MQWLRTWSISRKLMALGALGIVLVAVPTAFYLGTAIHQIRLAQLERNGVAPVRAILAVIQATQDHRGMSAGHIVGNTMMSGEREKKQAAADEARARMDALVKRDVDNAAIAEMWEASGAVWKKIAAGAASKSLSVEDSYAQHTALIAQYAAMLDRIADHFRISMDAEPEGYFLVSTSVGYVPKLTETLGQLRAKGLVLLTQRLATGDDSFNFTKMLGLGHMHYESVSRTLDKAMAATPELKQRLEGPAQEALKQAKSAIQIADRHIAQTDNLTYAVESYVSALTAAMQAQHALNDVALAQMDELLQRRVRAEWGKLGIVLGGIGAIIALAAALGLAIGRSVTRPLKEAVSLAEKVAAGDLTSNIQVNSSDEVGQLLHALRSMNDSLRNIAGEVRSGTESITAASKQLSAGNSDLSQRTEEQASSLEQTASSMEQLTSTVKQNADNAMQANQLAAGASDVAVQGGKVVGKVVETMSSINDSSRKIVDIIGVIDGIAFQTNILALNAAVEAARAGEQGRGFAVVAGEVRSLAQRSAAAAKEIKDLITDSVSKVEAGSALVDQAGKTMDAVVSSVQRVTDIIAEIAAASREQTEGIEQVNQAIAQMDEVTQQNAALVEEAAAAAESMEEQAQRLADAVAVFKVGEAPEQHPAAVDVAPPTANVMPLPRRAKPAAPRHARGKEVSVA
ncbi:MAG: methyl-accepting chemotaxis protein [Rhodospirillaceae bacterium]